MPRADGRIEAGESLDKAISARAWNRAQDAADIVLRQKMIGGSLAFGGSPYIALPFKASSTVERWGVVAITGLAISPAGGATQEASFADMPVLTGGTPTSTSQAFGIAVEPIESGKIGRVAVSGVVQAKVMAASANPTTAGIKSDSTSLVGGSTGANVLWIESGTGEKWALVRFGGGSPLRLCKTASAFDKGSRADLNVWESGTPGSETQTSGETVEDVVNKFADIESGKFVSVAMHANGSWYVVAAEC